MQNFEDPSEHGRSSGGPGGDLKRNRLSGQDLRIQGQVVELLDAIQGFTRRFWQHPEIIHDFIHHQSTECLVAALPGVRQVLDEALKSSPLPGSQFLLQSKTAREMHPDGRLCVAAICYGRRITVKKEWEGAEEILSRVIRLGSRCATDAVQARAWFSLGSLYFLTHQNERSQAAYGEGFTIFEEKSAKECFGIVSDISQYLGVCLAVCDKERAKQWQDKLHQIIEDSQNASRYEHHSCIEALRACSEVSVYTGQTSRANFELSAALKIAKQIGRTDFEAAISAELGELFLDQCKYQLAEHWFSKAMFSSRAWGLKNAPEHFVRFYQDTAESLCEALQAQGKMSEAMAVKDRVNADLGLEE